MQNFHKNQIYPKFWVNIVVGVGWKKQPSKILGNTILNLYKKLIWIEFMPKSSNFKNTDFNFLNWRDEKNGQIIICKHKFQGKSILNFVVN